MIRPVSINKNQTHNNQQIPTEVKYGREKGNGWELVDEWKPDPEDELYKTSKSSLFLPVSKFYNLRYEKDGGDKLESEKAEALDNFILTSKRCYNGLDMKDHLPLYMNYFEKYYDKDHELYVSMCKIKYMIDFLPEYEESHFINDIVKYIFSMSLQNKAHIMNSDNYLLNLDSKKYKNDKNPSLTYRDRHASTLMWMSLLMNMCIPLLTHYIYVHKIANVNGFLLKTFDIVLHMSSMDIYNKLYETCYSNIYKSSLKDKALWDMQPIRGKNVTTQTIVSVQNIILNIMPKYTYNKNNIYFNYVSIKKSNGYQVINIGFEYELTPLSSSKRDAESNSVFDKYESYLIKQDDGKYILNKVASEDAMKKIEMMFGPFDKNEIDYYINRLVDNNGNIINNFQKKLIFLLFHKYFGDPMTTNSINKIDYIKLMISAFKMLSSNHLIILPYIISSKVDKIITRKNVNKKELEKLQSSKYYNMVMDKYMDPKIENQILQIIATILSSSFIAIDYNNQDIDGKRINRDDPDPNCIRIPADFLGEEILMYITMI